MAQRIAVIGGDLQSFEEIGIVRAFMPRAIVAQLR
jgi:hypothetical protein